MLCCFHAFFFLQKTITIGDSQYYNRRKLSHIFPLCHSSFRWELMVSCENTWMPVQVLCLEIYEPNNNMGINAKQVFNETDGHLNSSWTRFRKEAPNPRSFLKPTNEPVFTGVCLSTGQVGNPLPPIQDRAITRQDKEEPSGHDRGTPSREQGHPQTGEGSTPYFPSQDRWVPPDETGGTPSPGQDRGYPEGQATPRAVHLLHQAMGLSS